MKKNIVVVSIFLLLFLNYTGIFSQTRPIKSTVLLIGYIDLQKVLFSHPSAATSMGELQKFQGERQRDLDEKIRGKDLSPDEKEKIADLAKKYEQEIAEKDNELTSKILSDVETVVEKIAKKLNISVVLEKQAIFFGGIDITEEVMKEISKQ